MALNLGVTSYLLEDRRALECFKYRRPGGRLFIAVRESTVI